MKAVGKVVVKNQNELPFTVKYRGEFGGGDSHGEGESVNSKGDRYFGGWSNGLRHGRGAYKWREGGQIYRGPWCEGKAQGKGVLTRPLQQQQPQQQQEEVRGGGGVAAAGGGAKGSQAVSGVPQLPPQPAELSSAAPPAPYTVCPIG